MTRVALPVVFLLATVPAAAQPPDGKASREALKKLDFLAGKWKGDATVMLGPKGKQEVKQTEAVEYRLGGTVLLIEGRGTGKRPDQDKEDTLFNALAVVSYDAEAKRYSIKAYRAEGQSVDAILTLTDKGFVWGFQEPRRKTQVRYTMTLNDKGEWHEVGEFSPDGKAWTKFIEMTLTRVKE
jgi:Protein of unknown function (DUF1579)